MAKVEVGKQVRCSCGQKKAGSDVEVRIGAPGSDIEGQTVYVCDYSWRYEDEPVARTCAERMEEKTVPA
jgi:hypothetical protein